MTARRIVAPPEFPVRWQEAGDAERCWSHDRLHYPDPVTPLEFSLIADGVDAGITKAARAYGIPIRVHDRLLNGYLYLAVEHWGTDAWSPSKLRDAMADLRGAWERQWLPEIRAHLSWWHGFDLPGADLPALRAHLAETVRRWQRLWEVHFLLLVPSMFAMSEFADLYEDVFEGAEPFDSYSMLAGFPSSTLESGRDLWALSRRARSYPRAVKILVDTDPAEAVARLRADLGSVGFVAEFDAYLATHGERADKLSLHHPYWVEDPTPVVKNLQNFLRQPDRDFDAEMSQAADQRERRAAEMRARIVDYPRAVREEVAFLLRAAQAGSFLAEEHGYWIDYKASYCVRRVLLRIGDRLLVAGLLDSDGDVFYLDLAELDDLVAGAGDAEGGRAGHLAAIAARKADAARFAGVAPPPLLGTIPGEVELAQVARDPISQMFRKIEGDVPAALSTGDLVVGNAGSPGIARGTVKVLHRLDEATKLEPGDILVADATAPPWTPLFASAGGLVTNSGGILSHSAVVAREYGIPAVVGAGNATAILRDGQEVEVDGTLGIVRILAPGPEDRCGS